MPWGCFVGAQGGVLKKTPPLLLKHQFLLMKQPKDGGWGGGWGRSRGHQRGWDAAWGREGGDAQPCPVTHPHPPPPSAHPVTPGWRPGSGSALGGGGARHGTRRWRRGHPREGAASGGGGGGRHSMLGARGGGSRPCVAVVGDTGVRGGRPCAGESGRGVGGGNPMATQAPRPPPRGSVGHPTAPSPPQSPREPCPYLGGGGSPRPHSPYLGPSSIAGAGEGGAAVPLGGGGGQDGARGSPLAQHPVSPGWGFG